MSYTGAKLQKALEMRFHKRTQSENRQLRNQLNKPTLVNSVPLFHLSFNPNHPVLTASFDREKRKFEHAYVPGHAAKLLDSKPWTTHERAADALEGLFQEEQYQDLNFVCWQSDSTPGREITVFSTNLKPRTEAEWKTLMTRSWKALIDAGVDHLGYCVPAGDYALGSQEGIATPISIPANSPIGQPILTPQDLQSAKLTPSDAGQVLGLKPTYTDNAALSELDTNQPTVIHQLAQLITDEVFWKSQHSSGKQVPTGLTKLIPLAKQFLEIPAPTLGDAENFLKASQNEAAKRLKAPLSKLRRQSVTQNLYDVLVKPELSFKTLRAIPEFQRLMNRYAIATNSSTVHSALKAKVTQLKTLLTEDHGQQATPKGMQRIKSELAKFDLETIDGLQGFLKKAHNIAHSRLRVPTLFQGKRTQHTKAIYQLLSQINEAADLLGNEKLDQLKPAQ